MKCESCILIFLLIHSKIKTVPEYDVLLIPVQKIPIKSKNVLYAPMQRQRYSKRVKKDDIEKLDIESYEEPTETPDVDSFDYGKDRDSERVGESHAYDFESNYGDDKIVGGVEVDINLYPYHVAYGSNCGGAIIDKRWVLTAGHCGKKPYIKAGSKYINMGKKVLVKKGHIHPMWSAKKKDHPFDFDFQLLELTEPLKFDENVQPIKIAHIEDMVIGKVITVTGWGNTEENGPYSNVLRAVRVPIISKEHCQNVPFPYFRGSLTSRMFCAGFSEGKKDACQGDSGGPAVAYDRLLGMVSFGYGCATPGSYGVYSKIAKVRTWVEQTTGIKFDATGAGSNLRTASCAGAAAAAAETLKRRKYYANNSIIGGYEIRITNAPYQVNYGDVCGGALIHKKWALTTAHCGTNHTYIRVGSSYRLKGPEVTIVDHIIHPKYKLKHGFDYDVQLLALNRPLRLNQLVQTIQLSGVVGQHIYVAGWGYQKEQGDYLETLQQVQIKMVSIKECQEVKNSWYNHTLTPRMFCAGGWGHDACQGDSGGAAVSFGKLVGLSSFGFGCGRSMPGVYTNISDSVIREWIRDYTGV